MAKISYEVCDRCGKKIGAAHLRLRWSLILLKTCFNAISALPRMLLGEECIEFIPKEKVLCSDCKKKFEQWLKEGKREDTDDGE